MNALDRLDSIEDTYSESNLIHIGDTTNVIKNKLIKLDSSIVKGYCIVCSKNIRKNIDTVYPICKIIGTDLKDILDKEINLEDEKDKENKYDRNNIYLCKKCLIKYFSDNKVDIDTQMKKLYNNFKQYNQNIAIKTGINDDIIKKNASIDKNLNEAVVEHENTNNIKKPIIIKLDKVLLDIKSPQDIKSKLDEYVIGQESAKKLVSVAIYIHLQKMKNPNISLEKSNILLIGNTGCGKTYIVKTIAKLLDVPLMIIPATQISKTGWKGINISNIISSLISKANFDLDKAKRSIIYIDEIDKLGNIVDSNYGNRPSIDVQSDLLTFIEGTTVYFQSEQTVELLKLFDSISISNEYSQENRNKRTAFYNSLQTGFDTSNILFITGGAFFQLTKDMKKKNNTSIGFTSDPIIDDKEDILQQVTTKDLISAGLLPELVGRLQIRCVLYKLDVESFKNIILKSKDSVYLQWKDYLAANNIDLEITDDAIESITKKSDELDLGARGIKSIIDNIMYNLLYDLDLNSTKKIVIDKNMIDERSAI